MIKRLFLRRRLHKTGHDAHHEHKAHCTSLCCARSGACVSITEICGSEEEAAKLRDLGVREGALVTVVRAGNPLLVRVEGARFGIGELAAQNVMCETIEKK